MKTPIIRKLLILNLVLVSSLFLDDCKKEINPFINSYNQDLSEKKYAVATTGTEHFFFLPPLAPKPIPTGTFAGSLAPVVQICRWTGTGCELPPIAEFTTTTGKGSERVRVVPEDELYIVNWNTKRFGLNLTGTYRIHVLLRIEEKVSIEIELGHLDVNLNGDGRTIPIKFRIEEGYSPIGELTALERAKISPVLLMQFLSQEVVEPVEALVNVFDDQLDLPELSGIEILKDYRPTLAQVFARISNPTTLASLVQLNNIAYVYENRKWYSISFPWQESIGQDLAQQSGYIGEGTAVAILDDGGDGIDHVDLPIPHVIDLSLPVFGCTDVGTPDGCRVVDEENPYWGDPFKWDHETYVARRVVETAPGSDIIAWDVGFYGAIEGSAVSEAIKWVLDHRVEYNIVAVNMSFSTSPSSESPAGPFSTEECPVGDDWNFQRLLAAGIMPIAGAGNDGGWQEIHNSYSGIGHPACSPYVVGVGGTTSFGLMWHQSTRGPNIDLLAPAEQEDGPPGTSFSTPAVAGAWAVLRAALPDLSLDETLELLKSTGTPVYDEASGLTFPLIQLDVALSAAGLSVVVYDNGEPYIVYDNGGSSYSGSAVGHFIAADDFTLSVAKSITGASVDVYDGPATENRRWDGTVEWWLFNNNGNLPGNLIASGIGVNIVQRNIHEISAMFGTDFTVDFDFGEAIALQPGEIYWLGLHMQSDYNIVSVYWYHTESTVLNKARSGGEIIGGVPNFVDGQYAGPVPRGDMAFRIKGK